MRSFHYDQHRNEQVIMIAKRVKGSGKHDEVIASPLTQGLGGKRLPAAVLGLAFASVTAPVGAEIREGGNSSYTSALAGWGKRESHDDARQPVDVVDWARMKASSGLEWGQKKTDLIWSYLPRKEDAALRLSGMIGGAVASSAIHLASRPAGGFAGNHPYLASALVLAYDVVASTDKVRDSVGSARDTLVEKMPPVPEPVKTGFSEGMSVADLGFLALDMYEVSGAITQPFRTPPELDVEARNKVNTGLYSAPSTRNSDMEMVRRARYGLEVARAADVDEAGLEKLSLHLSTREDALAASEKMLVDLHATAKQLDQANYDAAMKGRPGKAESITRLGTDALALYHNQNSSDAIKWVAETSASVFNDGSNTSSAVDQHSVTTPVEAQAQEEGRRSYTLGIADWGKRKLSEGAVWATPVLDWVEASAEQAWNKMPAKEDAIPYAIGMVTGAGTFVLMRMATDRASEAALDHPYVSLAGAAAVTAAGYVASETETGRAMLEATQDMVPDGMAYVPDPVKRGFSDGMSAAGAVQLAVDMYQIAGSIKTHFSQAPSVDASAESELEVKKIVEEGARDIADKNLLKAQKALSKAQSDSSSSEATLDALKESVAQAKINFNKYDESFKTADLNYRNQLNLNRATAMEGRPGVNRAVTMLATDASGIIQNERIRDAAVWGVNQSESLTVHDETNTCPIGDKALWVGKNDEKHNNGVSAQAEKTAEGFNQSEPVVLNGSVAIIPNQTPAVNSTQVNASDPSMPIMFSLAESVSANKIGTADNVPDHQGAERKVADLHSGTDDGEKNRVNSEPVLVEIAKATPTRGPTATSSTPTVTFSSSSPSMPTIVPKPKPMPTPMQTVSMTMTQAFTTTVSGTMTGIGGTTTEAIEIERGSADGTGQGQYTSSSDVSPTHLENSRGQSEAGQELDVSEVWQINEQAGDAPGAGGDGNGEPAFEDASGGDSDLGDAGHGDTGIVETGGSGAGDSAGGNPDAGDVGVRVVETGDTQSGGARLAVAELGDQETGDPGNVGDDSDADDSDVDEPDVDEPDADNSDEQGVDDQDTDDQEAPQTEPALVPLMGAAAPPAVATPIRPAAGAYNSNTWAANTMFQMNLNDRLGSYTQGEMRPKQGSAWIQYSGSNSRLKDDTGALHTKGDKNTVMMGVDMLVQSANGRDQYTVGVTGGYGHYKGRTHSGSFDYASVGKVDGYGVGLYGTYQQDADAQQGVYVDSWLLWNHFDNTVKGGALPKEKYDSKGMTASLELGYNFKLAERDNVKYVLQPHAQVIYQNVRAENFHEADGTRVDFLNGSRLQTAVGVRAAAHISTGLTSVITPHIEANWLHSTRGYEVRLDDMASNMDSGCNAGQLKLGVEGELNRSLSVNVELFHNQGNGGYRETGGNVMAKYRY